MQTQNELADHFQLGGDSLNIQAREKHGKQ